MAPNSTELQHELDSALQALESSLAGAAQAADELRQALPKVAALAEVLGDIEATITRVRAQRSQPDVGRQAGSPWLRPLGNEAPTGAPSAPPVEPEGAFSFEPSPTDGGAEEGEPTGEVYSNCLRLDVTTKGASLDLKAVDNAVNETADVMDVALLDYDGRHASLKVWVEESSDAGKVRDALREGLERRFGDDADIQVSFEEKPAA